MNVGGDVEHELERVRLRPVDGFSESRRRSVAGWRRGAAAGVGAAGRRVVAGGQVAVDGAGLAHRRHPVTHDRCAGRRQVAGGGGGDREVYDGEVDALSGLGVQPPRTAGRAALQVPGRRAVDRPSVDQVPVTGRHLDRLRARAAALSHRLTPRHCQHT